MAINLEYGYTVKVAFLLALSIFLAKQTLQIKMGLIRYDHISPLKSCCGHCTISYTGQFSEHP